MAHLSWSLQPMQMVHVGKSGVAFGSHLHLCVKSETFIIIPHKIDTQCNNNDVVSSFVGVLISGVLGHIKLNFISFSLSLCIIIVSAFVGYGIAFACLSGDAMLPRCREYLYLGGFLSASVSLMFWYHMPFLSLGGSAALYFGLLVFMGYMVVDTQGIIEKAHLGDVDCINHSLTLFTDMVAVFVRVLIIMV
ncbi:hypothetical protein MKW94_015817, partial [Papaver nudicaule]|nr:hypothetical protein [Papaver nudicaule]